MGGRSALRRFYRVIDGPTATEADFRSGKASGEPPPSDDPAELRMWEGISVNNTEVQARNKARDLPWLGQYVAERAIPDDGPIRYARTGRSRGHWTLWGESQESLSCVVRVQRARGDD